MKFITLFVALTTLWSCNAGDSSINAYRKIGAELNKDFKLTRSDLIVAYDLGRIDNTDCIYAVDLGLVINSGDYQNKYVEKFGRNFKSPTILRKESMNKVVRIYKLLLTLHKKYKILSNNQHQYVKRLSRADLTKIDSRRELERLNVILKGLPVMPPEYSFNISSYYGKRKHPVKNKYSFHCGLDLYSKVSAPIFASAAGKVIFAGKMNGYGNIVEVMHANNIKTRYAHLRSITVKKGQKLIRGQMLGRQGQSGKVTNEHLHFEIWIDGKHVNPYHFIAHGCNCNK